MKYLGKIEHKKDLINREYAENHFLGQFATMPAASLEYNGKIVQYTGETTSAFTKGHFYRCLIVMASYEWQEVDISSGLKSSNLQPMSLSVTAKSEYGQYILCCNGNTATIKHIVTGVAPLTTNSFIINGETIAETEEYQLGGMTLSNTISMLTGDLEVSATSTLASDKISLIAL